MSGKGKDDARPHPIIIERLVEIGIQEENDIFLCGVCIFQNNDFVELLAVEEIQEIVEIGFRGSEDLILRIGKVRVGMNAYDKRKASHRWIERVMGWNERRDPAIDRGGCGI